MLNKQVGDISLPVIGLGTYGLSSDKISVILAQCIECGITYVDSADRYGNESIIGQAVQMLGRKNFIIGTKLSYRQQISQPVNISIYESLTNLKIDYIDLYFIHSPKSNTYCQDWISIINARDKGLLREIGVSNFNIQQLTQLYEISGQFPAINQIEVNPNHYPEKTIKFCREHNIVVQASCPLCRMQPGEIPKRIIKDLETKYNKTYSQIVLRWQFQRDILTIPKVSSEIHMKENLGIFNFRISDADLRRIERGAIIDDV